MHEKDALRPFLSSRQFLRDTSRAILNRRYTRFKIYPIRRSTHPRVKVQLYYDALDDVSIACYAF